jgi:hypothetical protein
VELYHFWGKRQQEYKDATEGPGGAKIGVGKEGKRRCPVLYKKVEIFMQLLII